MLYAERENALRLVKTVTCVDIPERTVGVEVGPLQCPHCHKNSTLMNELYEGLFEVYLTVIASL